MCKQRGLRAQQVRQAGDHNQALIDRNRLFGPRTQTYADVRGRASGDTDYEADKEVLNIRAPPIFSQAICLQIEAAYDVAVAVWPFPQLIFLDDILADLFRFPQRISGSVPVSVSRPWKRPVKPFQDSPGCRWRMQLGHRVTAKPRRGLCQYCLCSLCRLELVARRSCGKPAGNDGQ